MKNWNETFLDSLRSELNVELDRKQQKIREFDLISKTYRDLVAEIDVKCTDLQNTIRSVEKREVV